MNAKIKKIVRKKSHIPKRETEVRHTNRIRDAVNELKRFGSPETLKEINKVTTPASCPAYPIIKRYNETKKNLGEKKTDIENPKTKITFQDQNHPFSSLSFYRTGTPLLPDNHKGSPQQHRITPLFQSKGMSLNPKLKVNAMSSKSYGLGKYNARDQPAPKKVMNSSINSSQRKPLTQVQNRSGNLSSTLYENNPIHHQNVATISRATIIPVHEMLNKQVQPKHPRRETSVSFCPGCIKARSSNTPQTLEKKRPLRADTSSNQKRDTLTYFISPPDLTRFSSNESAVKNKESKPLRKKKKVVMRPRRPGKKKVVNTKRTRLEKTPRIVPWKKENIKAFRVVEERKNDTKELPAKMSSSRSFKLERKNPAKYLEGKLGEREENYRMCKQCPLRQLISKIDPAVGQDKKSYPVVAFTCCRKGPNVKNASTST